MLAELIPAVRAASSARGHLSERELTEFSSRDLAAGRRCSEPIPGLVSGVAADGAASGDAGAKPQDDVVEADYEIVDDKK